ncbi:MAG TPA: PorV/PorQ family protein [Bacteroidota bacterium]|nr:PorV/PorQ family protein [Bacteroidota bacterium]
MRSRFLLLVMMMVPALGFSQVQNASTGLTFLKLGVGGRATGMGEAYTALAADASGIYYNPAGIAFGSSDEVTFMHRDWIFGTSVEYLGATLHEDSFAFGLGLNSTNVSDIEIRQDPGPALGTFGVHDFDLSANASWRVDSALSFGVAGKFVYEKIYVDEASGYALDIGSRYSLSRSLSLGAAILNIGSTSKLGTSSVTLPTTFRVGGAYSGLAGEDVGWTIATDLVKVPQDAGARFHLGAEATFESFLALRFGYQIGYDAKTYSAGLGVHYGMLEFDYAFVPFLDELGNTHTFGLTFTL